MGAFIIIAVLFFVVVLGFGFLSNAFGLGNVIAYGIFVPFGVLVVVRLFKLLANSVKTVELESQGVEPEGLVDPKRERLKLDRLKARLEGHVAVEAVKKELEHRKANPPPPVTPTPYRGGGTLPGARGDPMTGMGD